MWWYDANPSGRTMSRFTSDLQIIETLLWTEIDAALQLGGFALVSVVLACTLQGGLLVIPALVMGVFILVVMDATSRSAREVKRLANNAVSPILTGLTEIRIGAPAIRAMALQPFFAVRQRKLIETWAGFAFHEKALKSWGLVNASFSAILSLGVGLYLIATREQHNPALSALAVTYAYVLPYYISIVVQICIQTVISLTALERLLEFLDLPQESARRKPSDPSQAGGWPTAGKVEFKALSVR